MNDIHAGEDRFGGHGEPHYHTHEHIHGHIHRHIHSQKEKKRL